MGDKSPKKREQKKKKADKKPDKKVIVPVSPLPTANKPK